MKSRVAYIFFALVSAAAALAHAENWQPINEAKTDSLSISSTWLVAIAYGFIWLAVLVYLLLLGRRLKRLEQELEHLGARQAHKSE